MPHHRVEIDEAEALDLHFWVQRFDHLTGGRRLGLEPWYLDGVVPLDATEADREALATAVYEIMCELVPADDFTHYADVQHEYARFYPHRTTGLTFDELFVEGETGSYVSPDRSWGIVSFGWTGPVVVVFFGEALLSRLRSRSPALLARLLPMEE